MGSHVCLLKNFLKITRTSAFTHGVGMMAAGWMVFLMLTSEALAATKDPIRVHCLNGDRISGTLIEDNNETMVLQTAFGVLRLPKDQIVSIEPLEDKRAEDKTHEEKSTQAAVASQEEQPQAAWTRRMSLGYGQSGGNTQTAQGQWDVLIHRKREKVNEWTMKLSSFYSSENKKMNGRKFYGLMRYAESFGRQKTWYWFVKFEADQDRFGGIDRRFIPSSGVGYWFFDEENIKAMVEMAAGYQHTRHRTGDREDQPILIPRGFASRTFFGRMTVSQDLVLYPSLTENQWRLRSESKMSVALKDNLNWTVSFLDEYNNAPKGAVKKNDYRLVSSLEFLF